MIHMGAPKNYFEKKNLKERAVVGDGMMDSRRHPPSTKRQTFRWKASQSSQILLLLQGQLLLHQRSDPSSFELDVGARKVRSSHDGGRALIPLGSEQMSAERSEPVSNQEGPEPEAVSSGDGRVGQVDGASMDLFEDEDGQSMVRTSLLRIWWEPGQKLLRRGRETGERDRRHRRREGNVHSEIVAA